MFYNQIQIMKKAPQLFERLAGVTRLELATSAVTGQCSNQLNYTPVMGKQIYLFFYEKQVISYLIFLLLWALMGSNQGPHACKACALNQLS